ncbi:unnamed protein product, partial [Ceratitis capitata]
MAAALDVGCLIMTLCTKCVAVIVVFVIATAVVNTFVIIPLKGWMQSLERQLQSPILKQHCSNVTEPSLA